jgi:ATP-dependent Lhr-like helicase
VNAAAACAPGAADLGRLGAAAAWFEAQGWQAFAFQQQVWRAMLSGRSGLLHATTGSGKTYAVWLGALLRARAQRGANELDSSPTARPGLRVLWLTPMRALAADTRRALEQPLPSLAPMWRVGLRTGDTASSERARQDKALPQALVTTPESLSLLLTRASAEQDLGRVDVLVVDEWHELIGSKRGVQVQLAVARLRRWNPGLVVWGLSATLGNLDEAMRTLVGEGTPAELVQGRIDKQLVIDTLLPQEPGRFSWGGHLGAQMLQPVLRELEAADGSTLIFTNVRSQAEIWYQLLLQERPDWAGSIALHHGSLDKTVREWVEAGLKAGQLKAVVATSSLDLGVDFLPVQRVLQIGSAKGIARLLQRAGRSGHAPGRASRITLVPTNTLELVEAAAARRAVLAGQVEPRRSPEAPLDVLVQHLVTVALGGGFEADALFEEVCTAPAYRSLTREAFDWALAFVERGGTSLNAYPEYHRVQLVEGRYRVTERGIAHRHRLQVGTIVSDASMQVKWLNGTSLGSIEESFIARLNKGDCFVFGGRLLEYIRTQDMAAYVRKASKPKGQVPTWGGSKMPLSSELAQAVQAMLDDAAQAMNPAPARPPAQAMPSAQADAFEPEMQAAWPMLAAQARLSRIPTAEVLLVERYASREGEHLFLYPFAGRNVHIGLAQLLAYRLSRHEPNTFSLSINDYGLEILAAKPIDTRALEDGSLFATRDLLPDVLASLNSGELAQRRFREIARVAGLVFNGYPGAPKSMKQLQASSGLFFEVFKKYDPHNALLTQAENEVLAQELDVQHLERCLKRLQARLKKHPLLWVQLPRPSPFALALMVERLREELSTEKLKDRLERILAEAEAVLAEPVPLARGGTQ